MNENIENAVKKPKKLPENWFINQLEWLLRIKHEITGYNAFWDIYNEYNAFVMSTASMGAFQVLRQGSNPCNCTKNVEDKTRQPR